MEDNINHPKHYELDKIECIDAMEMTQGRGAVMSFCLCNAFKYLWRHDRKNGLEDIKKAKWYLDKYLELAEKSKKEINDKFGYMDGGYCDTDNQPENEKQSRGIYKIMEEDIESIKPIWTDKMTDAVKQKESIDFMDAPKELKDQFFMEMMKRASNDAPKKETAYEYFKRKRDEFDDMIDEIAAEHKKTSAPIEHMNDLNEEEAALWQFRKGQCAILFETATDYCNFRIKYSDRLLLPKPENIYGKHPEIIENDWPVVIYTEFAPCSNYGGKCRYTGEIAWAIAQSDWREVKTINGKKIGIYGEKEWA